MTNHYVVELQGEKIRSCMQETLRRGRWPWAAPIGYINARDERGEDRRARSEAAPLVRRAFELMAAGDSFAGALARVTALGLRSATDAS